MDFINFISEYFVFDLSFLLAVLSIVLVTVLACRYHTEKMHRNAVLVNHVNWRNDKRFVLTRDFKIKFFCRQEYAKKVFTIPAGAIFILCQGKAVFRLAGRADVPENIKNNFGMAIYNVFVFRISPKLFKKTDLPMSESAYNVYNISSQTMEICEPC